VQSVDAAATGTWWWLAQAPPLPSGAVWALFTYRADHDRDPWVEFDWEFLGRDVGPGPEVTRVRLNIHMAEGRSGGHRTLEEAQGGPVVVDLQRACGSGFDAAAAMHLFEVTVTDRDATFAVDGRVVGRFGAAEMGGLWRTTPMRGCASLWCAGPELEGWAGRWLDPGRPLVGRVAELGYVSPVEGRRSWLRGLNRRTGAP
jgi:hypothetical protein